MALRVSTKASTNKKTIEETYSKVTQLEHILLRSDTYIGSVERFKQQTWVWDDEKECMQNRDITYPPGLYKIFDEILVNAADHKQRDSSMTTIKVEIDTENQMITVWNNGAGIPVEIHQKEGVYVPELIFGHLLTSSNYNDDEKKVVGGRNGYGAKLANIFSTEFIVETADSERGKRYKQVFRNNMSEKDKPILKSNPKNESWTKISFSPDLKRFDMTHLDADIVSLMMKRVYDIAGINRGLIVYLNGKKLRVKNFQDYIRLYHQGDTTTPLIHEKTSERWEVAIAPSDGQLSQVSFVNSIWTVKGGTHVAHVADQIVSKVSEHIAKKNKGMKLKPFQIKSHLSLYVNCLIENPAFDSQTKETLTTKPSKFGSKWSFSEELAKKVMKSGVVENILSFAKFKESKELSKTDGGKKARVLGVPKLDDANKAGGREASKCTLILTEGDSAKTLAVSGLSVVGRDYYGVFPLRGKLLNVRDAKHKQIMDNAEINNIKKILGLQHNKSYTAETVKSLRYGHVLIMADQDHDGSHIKGLVINFFDHFWPTLLQVEGFLQEFITPIVKCVKGRDNKVFFTMPEYKRWVGEDGGRPGWKAKYYKGLGTSTAAEAKSYFSNLPRHLHEFQYIGQEDTKMIEMAFSKNRVSDRKEWLASYTPGTFFDHGVDELNYSNFVNKELILFSIADNVRSIPSVIDGFKPSQRKVLYACFKRKLTKSEIKVVQLAGYVAEHGAYHHGEVSLQSTIVGLAQNFVGSNNINILVPAGQFGTRLQGGKDAASSRYIFTKLAPIARALFPELDDPLLKYLEEDGQSIEPEWYCPVIPTVLVNGSDGIGTGWSSSIPCHNPRDLINNIRRLLNGQQVEPMLPWYRGFKGSIVPVENAKSFDVYGTLKRGVEPHSFRIEELPIRSWTTPFKEFLETNLIASADGGQALIKDYQDNSTENVVKFTFTASPEYSSEMSGPNGYKKLKLTGSITTSNMVLFDPEGRIQKYETPEDILREFFTVRLSLYTKRREYLLRELEMDLLCLDNKQRFIKMVIDGKLKVAKRKKAEILTDLKRLDFTPIPKRKQDRAASVTSEDEEEETGNASRLENGYDYLLAMPLWSLTEERVNQLIQQRNGKAEEKEAMENTSPKELWERDLVRLEEALTKDEIAAEKMELELAEAAMEARARQRGKGKGRKGKAAISYAQRNEDSADEDYEVVPVPSIRTLAVKKTRTVKAAKPVAKTEPKKVKKAKKVEPEMILDDDDMSESEADFDSEELFSADDAIGADGLLDQMAGVSLGRSSIESQADEKKNKADARKKRSVKAKPEAVEIASSSEEEAPVKPVRTRATRSRAAPKKKTTKKAEPEVEDVDISGGSDNEVKPVQTKSLTQTEVALDSSDDSDVEASMTLSQRLAKRLTVAEATKTAESKSTKRVPASKVTAANAKTKQTTTVTAKRPRGAKPKKPVDTVDIISPSPSPQPKKTRVISPKAKQKGRGAAKVALKENEKKETVPSTRPRRARAVLKPIILSDSDEDSVHESSDNFEDDDDSDFE